MFLWTYRTQVIEIENNIYLLIRYSHYSNHELYINFMNG